MIQAIDTWFENRRLGLLFEASAGNGNLVVCSINLKEDLDERPVSRQLLKSILDNMNSPEFDPETEINPDQIRLMLKEESGLASGY